MLVHVFKYISIYLYSYVPIGPSLTVCVFFYPCFVWVRLLVCSQMCLCVQKCLDACGRQGYRVITLAETLSQRDTAPVRNESLGLCGWLVTVYISIFGVERYVWYC